MTHKISSFLSDRVVITGLVLVGAQRMEARGRGSGQAGLTQMGRESSSGTEASLTETMKTTVLY